MIKKIYAYAIVATVTASLIAAGAVLKGCSSGGNDEFNDFIEIADEHDSELPKATEVGANTAGAYYETELMKVTEKKTWTLNYKNHYASQGSYMMRRAKDTLEFSLIGIRMPYSEPVTIKFFLPNVRIDSLTGLQTLSSQNYSLAQKTLSVSVSGVRSTMRQPVTAKDAGLHFTRCRLIYANGKDFKGVSVSGTFAIKGAASDTIPVNISDGRFDIFFRKFDGVRFYNQE